MPSNTENVIYNKKHSIRVNFGQNWGDSDEKIVTVKIVVDGDVLSIKLYDDDDVTFNYTTTINAVAYEKIKTEQSLDIDFDEFKTQLMELLKQTLSNKMLLRLETSDTTCRMVFYEKSKLKSLIFLVVELKPTDYRVIIGELSEMIVVLKRTNKNMESHLNQTKKHLHQCTLEVNSSKENIRDLRVAFFDDLNKIERHFSTEAATFEKTISKHLDQVCAHVQNVFGKVDALKDELKSKDELIGRLTRTLNAERLKNDKTNQIIYDFKVKIDSLQRAKEETEQECARLKQSVRSMQQMVEDVQTKCDEQANDLEKAAIVIAQKQKSHDEISRDLVQANNMIVNFNQHYEKALKELEEVKTREGHKNNELEQHRVRLNQFLQEFEDYKRCYNEEDIGRVKNELCTARHRICELEKTNREVNKINALLTKRLSEVGFYDGK